MLQCEDHGVCHKHTAGLLGDRSRQDVGVDGEGDVAFAQVPHSPQCGVLGAEELTQVFVENEYQLRHTCNKTIIRHAYSTMNHKKRMCSFIDFVVMGKILKKYFQILGRTCHNNDSMFYFSPFLLLTLTVLEESRRDAPPLLV